MFEKSCFVARSVITALFSFCLVLGASVNTHAYDVEADSVNNSIYILLRNLNSDDAYDSISVTNTAPGIVSAASATIIPASVAASGSDIAAVEFTVAAGATIGATGNLAITVSGTVAGQDVDVDIMVPLEVVANVAATQGFVGTGVPAPDSSGVDSDGDGVSDALELAFGSNPNSADSEPGDPVIFTEENVPMLGFLGMLVMGLLFTCFGSAAVRRNAGVLMLLAVTFLPMDLNAGSTTRIHLIAEIPIPPPPPVLLTISSATASSQLTPAASAIDGSITTRWESAHGIDPQTLTVDLGATHLLSEVVIQWEAANAASYRIDGSLDGSNWTTDLASFSGGTWDPGAGVRRTDTLSVSGSYRYVRMYGLTRPAGNSYGYSIWEIDVYGNAIIDTDNDGVADSDDQCPSTAAGSEVDANGCIIIDTDDDGVPDASDLCANTPVGSYVGADGCVINAVLISVTASASSGSASASLAVDGNMASRWASDQGVDPSWLQLDFGGVYDLAYVTIDWEAANAATYEIQGSMDSEDWTTLASESGGVFGDRTDTVTVSGMYRYIRMHGLTRTSPYGYSIWEMEVYGEEAPDADGDGVSDSLDQCPNTAAGSSVDANGCVILDTDNDGVPDSADICPNTPADSLVDADGCVIIIYVNEVASINGILAGGSGSSQPGLTLYVFDSDPVNGGVSNCNGGCATNWPPLLVGDGVPSGVSDLSVVVRTDGSEQVAYNGRPLYYFIADSAVGDTNGDGAGGVWHKVAYAQLYANLFDNTSVLEPDTQFETADALVTRWSDRPRTRHAREAQYQSYDHYIKFYFEDRSSNIEIIDYVAKGGDTIEMNVRTIFPLSTTEAENRWWFASPSAKYMSNTIMDYKGFDGTYYYYQKVGTNNPRTNSAIAVGDRLEIEISQFSAAGIPRGQANYYGTVFLYIVGEGIVPWYAETGNEDSQKIPEEYWLGGETTIHYQYSDEPNDHFLQMATNLGYENGQNFLLGRRVHHSSFVNGMHDEDPANGVLSSNAGLAGTRYINERCSDCHERNGSAPVADNGELLDRWVFKVGDANGNEDPNRGHVLQPNGSAGEGSVSIASWTELSNGLRTPNYQFTGGTPATFSARIAPRLVGLGLLEAIVESDIEALADPNDLNNDGISGRMSLVTDAITGENRVGRFGWKAAQPTVKHQAASALSTDLGVRTSVVPNPDCGSAQTNCGENSPLMPDENLDNLTLYLSALGVRPQRVWKQGVEDQQVLQGRELFRNNGCVDCHTETFQTSEYHPLAEVRNQTIHPYSDMLLHDMGPGLADNLGEGVATGSEWRTTPLWGLGLSACVTGGVINPSGTEGGESCTPHHAYLHDGRARSIDEAIMWHGGEAAASQSAYSAMSASDKALMIRFLESL